MARTSRSAALLALLLVTVLPVLGQPARAASDPVPAVLIESVKPAAPGPRADLEISGRVGNTGASTLFAPLVQLRLSPLPLNSREEVTQVLDGTSGRLGIAIPGTANALQSELAPGQQQEFSLSVPMDSLGLPADAAGVYAIFVELSTDLGPVATAGTVFPWFPADAEFQASGVAMMWPIVATPAVAAQDLVLDPQVVTEITPGGRLDRLVSAGSDNPVNWILDSATWQTTTAMGDGYEILMGDARQPGDSTAIAQSFAERLAVVAEAPSVALPQFAIDDADALQRGGQDSSVVRSATLPTVIRDELGRDSDVPTRYVAPGGISNDATLQTLIDAGIRQLLLSDRWFPPDPATDYTPSGTTTLTVAGTKVDVQLSDSRLTRILAGPFNTAAQRSSARQALLADTAMITLERPAEPRSVIALPPLGWDPPPTWLSGVMRDLRNADWIRLVSTDDVAGSTSVPRQRLPYGQDAQDRELPQNYITRIGQLQGDLERLSRVVNDPTGFGETFSLALQRASSSWWRGRPAARTLMVDTIGAQLQHEIDRVRVLSTGTVTLSGQSGTVPLTIANDLDRAVTVGLRLRAASGVGVLKATPPPPVRIDAMTKRSVEVPVEVVGSQPIRVEVVLTDRTGAAFNAPTSFELQSTAATRIAGVVVGVGGVTLAFLVALNLWRRHANRDHHHDVD